MFEIEQFYCQGLDSLASVALAWQNTFSILKRLSEMLFVVQKSITSILEEKKKELEASKNYIKIKEGNW